MDTHSARVGRRLAGGRAIVPDPARTADHLAVVDANLLIGGMPGAGKSALLALLTVHEVLSTDKIEGGGRTRADR